MNDAEFRKIVEQVKENRGRLNNCPLHSFTIPVPKPYNKNIIDKYKCENCGGVVDYKEKIFYEKGLEHGRNSKTN